MTDSDMASALAALALTEADSDDVRIVQDDDWGALVVAHIQTPKHGTHLVLVTRSKGETAWTRTRLCGRHIHALYQVTTALVESSE